MKRLGKVTPAARTTMLQIAVDTAAGVEILPLLEDEARERQGHGMTAPGVTLMEIIPEASGPARVQSLIRGMIPFGD